eukprot:m.393293 g.393293  ORF g.393293 m.393293 type:complete len:327 (+) comp16765_c0_seq26:736-1716(+)
MAVGIAVDEVLKGGVRGEQLDSNGILNCLGNLTHLLQVVHGEHCIEVHSSGCVDDFCEHGEVALVVAVNRQDLLFPIHEAPVSSCLQHLHRQQSFSLRGGDFTISRKLMISVFLQPRLELLVPEGERLFELLNRLRRVVQRPAPSHQNGQKVEFVRNNRWVDVTHTTISKLDSDPFERRLDHITLRLEPPAISWYCARKIARLQDLRHQLRALLHHLAQVTHKNDTRNAQEQARQSLALVGKLSGQVHVVQPHLVHHHALLILNVHPLPQNDPTQLNTIESADNVPAFHALHSLVNDVLNQLNIVSQTSLETGRLPTRSPLPFRDW